MKVKVYMDFINHCGDVIESVKIAEFIGMTWAKDFIEIAKQSEDKITRIRVEEK